MKNNRGNIGPHLELEDLVVSYYKKDILFGVSLKVMPGEIVGLIGANGSGKSTLLKAVAGVIKPKSGRVMFEGTEITDKESSELAHFGLGFLMQGGLVFPSLNVVEHLQLANDALGKANFEERVDIVWNTFPTLFPIRKNRAGLLSGGERQMLGISMLIIQKAKLWMLDEPTGSLAPETVSVLMKKIEKLNSEEGVTVVLAEQNLNETLKISRRVFVLKNGLAYEETPEGILNSERLGEIFFTETYN